ncbi:MAG: exonuclease domain-containing protein [Brevefilum sp.]|nr:exonuclease domain-containing protein [Brevefilum sp.]
MAKLLDKIIVVDLEATCWEGDPPPGETSEIIEIGLCTLDVKSGERSDRRGIMVKPEHSSLSDYCIELTTIHPEMLKNAPSLREACRLLQEKYHSDRRTWASYGDYDRIMLAKQCQELDMPYPFGKSHINVKNLLALHFGLKHEVDLKRGTALVDLPFEGTIHRGVDDAWNIAAVLSRVLLGRDR